MPSSLVSWTDHGSVVAAGLRKLYAQRETHADFEIRCMGGQRAFRVHKLVLALFTDFFRDMDGLWARLDVDPELVEILLAFLYVGEAVVDYDKMEDFLQLCLRLRVQLFKDVVPKSIAPKAVPDHNPVTDTTNPEAAAKGYSERYELNDFRLLCPRCFKCFQNEKKAKAHKLACLTPVVETAQTRTQSTFSHCFLKFPRPTSSATTARRCSASTPTCATTRPPSTPTTDPGCATTPAATRHSRSRTRSQNTSSDTTKR